MFIYLFNLDHWNTFYTLVLLQKKNGHNVFCFLNYGRSQQKLLLAKAKWKQLLNCAKITKKKTYNIDAQIFIFIYCYYD